MKCPLYLPLTFASLLLLHSAAASERTFTNHAGQTIKAKLVSHSGDNIQLDTGDRLYSVPINSLSLDDQVYVRDWIGDNPEAIRLKFSYRADLRRYSPSRLQASDSDTEDSLIYEVSIGSQNPAPVRYLKVKYQIFLQRSDSQRLENSKRVGFAFERDQKRKPPKASSPKRIRGTVDMPYLIPGESIQFEKSFQPSRDTTKVGLADTSHVLGIWIRVYQGDALAGEYKDSRLNGIADLRW